MSEKQPLLNTLNEVYVDDDDDNDRKKRPFSANKYHLTNNKFEDNYNECIDFS
jgi:hypothetical protein